MKRFAERFPCKKPSSGYLAYCRRCGALVVHAFSTGEPLHMHRWSKKCREALPSSFQLASRSSVST
jgi:hypothetical protein